MHTELYTNTPYFYTKSILLIGLILCLTSSNSKAIEDKETDYGISCTNSLTNTFPGFPIDFEDNNCGWIDYYLGDDLILTKNGDGTMTISGTIDDAVDADFDACTSTPCGSDDAWTVNLTLFDKLDWTQFQNQGGTANIHPNCSGQEANLEYWDVSGTLVGTGCNTGRTLTITAPVAPYRMQIGEGAISTDSGCSFGMSTWFEISEGGNSINADIYAFLDETCYFTTTTITANDDDFRNVTITPTGGTAGNILLNDEYNGATPTGTDVDITLLDNGGLTNVTIDSNGDVIVPANAVPNNYTLTYQICEAGATTFCDAAFIYLQVLPTPFSCDESIYMATSVNSSTPSQMYEVNTTVSPYVLNPVGNNNGTLYNALGYREQDDYIYGIIMPTNEVVRIGADGIEQNLGAATGLPMPGDFNGAYDSGDVFPDGYLYIHEVFNHNEIYQIDVTTSPPTLVATHILDQSVYLSDFAYNTVDDKVYGVGDLGEKYMIDPATWTVTIIGTNAPANSYGGAYTDNEGNVYVYANNPGAFFKVDFGLNGTGTGNMTMLSSAPNVAYNDGASCRSTPPPLIEICGNGMDDDGDNLTDCDDPDCKNITIGNPVVSTCINQPLRDVATVTVDISWINAPNNDIIEVILDNKTEYINVAGGATSPQTVTFIVTADGSTGKTITTNWRNTTSLCPSTSSAFDVPVACSSDEIACEILYLCGDEKPYDGDAWDHGWIEYLDELNGARTVTPILVKPDAAGMGTYDPNNPTDFVNVNLTDYDLIIVSATTENYISTDLVNDLKDVSTSLLNANYTIIDDLGMSTETPGFYWETAAYIDNVTSVEIYNYDNIDAYYNNVFTHGDPLANGDAFLWADAGDQAAQQRSYFFAYEASDTLLGVASTHGSRVYLGYHMNGVYGNPVNGGVMPVPMNQWFKPENHLTLEGKNYFDQAIKLASANCGIVPNTTKAENDINQTPMNEMVSGNILTNDTDNEGDNQTVQSATYINSSGIQTNLPFGMATNIYNGITLAGSMTLNPDGSYDFSPATNYTGIVEIDYIAIDDNSNPATDGATLTIEILPDPTTDGTNNGVVAQDDTNTVEQGGTVTSVVLTNDSDPDGDIINVTGATASDGSGGTVALTSTLQDIYDADGVLAGQASLDVNGNVIFVADISFEGDVPVDYSISDGNGATDDAVLTITVLPLDASNATYANDDANTGLQEETLTGNVLTNDNDPEGNTQTVTTATSSDGTTITPGAFTPTTLVGIGTLEIEMDGNYIFIPTADFVGTETVIYTVCDDGNPVACETATLYLTILPVNTIEAEDDINNTPYETQVRGDVSTNDKDKEGDNQTFTLGIPNGGMDNAEGTVTLNTNGSYIFVPADSFIGKTSFMYTVCDDGRPVMCETATVYIVVFEEISPEGQTITANVDANTVNSGQMGTGNVLFNDVDMEGRRLQMTTTLAGVSVDGVDIYGNAVANAGTITMTNDGIYNFTPTGDFTGEVIQSYTACTTTFPAECDNSELIIKVIPNDVNTTHAADDAVVAEANIQVIGNILSNDRDSESDNQSVSSFIYDSNGNGKANTLGTLDTDIEIGGYDETGAFITHAGTLRITSTGDYTFVSEGEFWGNAVVPYTVCDDATNTACDNASLVITVLPINRDYGDAPAIYPEAWHRAMTDTEGDGTLDGATDVWLGAKASFESSRPVSEDAGTDGFDDAIVFGTEAGEFPRAMLPSSEYDISIMLNANASDLVYYGMWIDWDEDGTYDDFYGGSAAVFGPTPVTVKITAPTFIGGKVNVRIRADDDELLASDFTGGRRNGEVEDYQDQVLLPVELLYFEGKDTDCSNELTWATATEENNHFFIIEYSKNGDDFIPLERVEGNGNSSEVIEYGYTHRDVTNLYSYYRLLQVDYDGSLEYSNVVFIKSNCEGLSSDDIRVYPNPSKGPIVVEIPNDTGMEKEMEIMVTDALGRILLRKEVMLAEGVNRDEVNLSFFPAGLYMISIINGSRKIKTYPINLITD